MGSHSSEIQQPLKATLETELLFVVLEEVFVMQFTHSRMDLRAAVDPCATQTNHSSL